MTTRSKLLCAVMILCVVLSFCSCIRTGREERQAVGADVTQSPSGVPQSESQSGSFETQTLPVSEPEEIVYTEDMRAFWMSYLEIGDLFSQGQAGFEQRLTDSFSSLARQGFDTVIFHARAFCDAFYASSIFPWSSALTENATIVTTDPLAAAINAAHAAGMKLHAWINPYRVSYNNDPNALPAGSPARGMLESGAGNRLMITESGIYLNPAYVENQALIIDGVREILSLYAVDGVHIDDYFYPSDIGDADAGEYQIYTASGGGLSLGDWRRANVNALVGGLYSAVKSMRPDIPFGISPGGVFETNYDTYYADVELWVKNGGYCDYIAPQIYFGFRHGKYAYEPLLSRWNALCENSGVKLYVGLALYKSGKTDAYAVTPEGVGEWQANGDIIARQILAARRMAAYRGFAVFSYGDLLEGGNETKSKERQNLTSLLSSENHNG